MTKHDKVSKNFELDEPIKNITDFIFVLNNTQSFYWRHKVMPTAFFWSWTLKQILEGIERGDFWTIQQIVNSK